MACGRDVAKLKIWRRGISEAIEKAAECDVAALDVAVIESGDNRCVTRGDLSDGLS
jgi:hypothetical protein